MRVDLDPGAKFRYSGGGYTVAQLAMTDVTGQPFPALMQRLVLGPLAMKESTYDQPLPAARLAEAAVGYRADGKAVEGKRHVYPEMAAAGLWTTPSDLARFAIGLQRMLHGGKGPLSKTMAENMVTPRKDGYGLGLGIEEEGQTRYFTHGGSNEGFRTLLLASENRGYGAVIMTNSDNGGPLIQEILRAIAAAYYWEGYQIDPITPAKLTAEQLAIYVGRYRLDASTIYIVEPAAGGLKVRVPLEETFTLVPVSLGGYVRRDAETRYTFGAARRRRRAARRRRKGRGAEDGAARRQEHPGARRGPRSRDASTRRSRPTGNSRPRILPIRAFPRRGSTSSATTASRRRTTRRRSRSSG